jgi:hypothetical protein
MQKIEESADAFRAGQAACLAGEPITDVPSNIWTAGDWLDGWQSAQRDKEIEQHVEHEAKNEQEAPSADRPSHKKDGRR